MDAYVLSNIRHDAVEMASDLADKIRVVDREQEDITISFIEAEQIRDILCDVNLLLTEILHGIDINISGRREMPF